VRSYPVFIVILDVTPGVHPRMDEAWPTLWLKNNEVIYLKMLCDTSPHSPTFYQKTTENGLHCNMSKYY
jgi:hypothetical protein